MDNKTFANQILKGLDAVFGIKAELGSKNLCTLTHKETLQQYTIELPNEGNLLYLYTQLMPLPFSNREEIFEYILQLNLHGMETRGCIIAIDKMMHLLVCSRVLDLETLNENNFPKIFQDFVDSAHHITEKIRQYILNVSNSSVSADTSTSVMNPQHLII